MTKSTVITGLLRKKDEVLFVLDSFRLGRISSLNTGISTG